VKEKYAQAALVRGLPWPEPSFYLLQVFGCIGAALAANLMFGLCSAFAVKSLSFYQVADGCSRSVSGPAT